VLPTGVGYTSIMGSLALQLAQLHDLLAAYRSRARALDAKLRAFVSERAELAPLRERVLASSARLDDAIHHAIDDLLDIPFAGRPR
jgi:Asp-tRNA(Asn)/Glu-tRNA(Gln) amidotransferase A subunit family amidase